MRQIVFLKQIRHTMRKVLLKHVCYTTDGDTAQTNQLYNRQRYYSNKRVKEAAKVLLKDVSYMTEKGITQTCELYNR